MGTLDRIADWLLFCPDRLLRGGQRELHHDSLSDSVCCGILVHGLDVAATGALLRVVAECGDAYQTVSGWSLNFSVLRIENAQTVACRFADCSNSLGLGSPAQRGLPRPARGIVRQ